MLKIIEVSKDTLGAYVKLNVQLTDGQVTIRWGMDDFTYVQLKKIVTTKYFDSLATEYHYELVPHYTSYQEKPKTKPVFRGYVRCILQRKSKNLEFLCSERFAGNMEWFCKEIKSIKDLTHLEWINFENND